jgi:hypothetical protein
MFPISSCLLICILNLLNKEAIMQKRLISLITLFAVGTMFVSSCGNDSGISEVTSSVASETTTADTDSQFESDSLPKLDFKGETINVLYRDDVVNSFYVNEQTGDIVDDAVYRANRVVEERLNITFNITTKAGSANADRTTYMAAITNSVLAGDNEYDLSGVLTYNVPTLIQQGVLMNLLDVNYLNFEKPWWIRDLAELATVDGKLFFASGDISLELTQRIFCMLFNKNLAESLGTENIYALVNDGKWTLDKMKEIAASAYSDLNGNSKVDPEDRYGLIMNDYNHPSGFIGSFELNMTSTDSDGVQHIDFGNERTTDAIQKIVSLFNDNKGIYYNTASDADPNTVEANHAVYRSMFKDSRALLISTEFNQISSVYRDMKDEYGVIPYPKYDENQDNYFTLARNVYSSFVILKTCTKADIVGAAMEALASENYRTTSPIYFETALKVKYSRDDTTSQMYDIIKNGLRFNFGYTFNAVCANLVNTFIDAIKGNNPNWASTYASKKDAAETALQKFYTDVRNFD